ncbi:family 6 glucosyltransferase [Segatella bryantii]|nr:family 6 glucosyltransferase [Segatella bryantii]UKK80343.1 hypothetical protein L6474_06665 [Segatella bryantii]SDM01882.1 Glycosyltransferase family 6 [Segatella bryantii]SDZ83372.1 Glycosyltransferase family 6 [Segatella bryantii]
MTVGIFYICTGKYSIFWDSFYHSCEEFFLPDTKKIYYVFTDDEAIKATTNICRYQKTAQGFPLDSLLRFDMFEKIENDTEGCDYLFFFNSNMKFNSKITENMILPNPCENGLVAVIHPGYVNSNICLLPYERHKKSTAYIKYNSKELYQYFMGSLNGGTRKEYYKLIHECNKNVQEDIKNHVMALYHDESHLNKYLHNKNIKKLSPLFAWPEDTPSAETPKIIIQNKAKHGGKYFDKLPKTSYIKRGTLILKRLYWAITWKIK